MDRLQANQQLNANDELVSNNGWFRLTMAADGSMAISRTQTMTSIWSPYPGGSPGNFAAMQDDGNFVVYTAQGAVLFATGTVGVPGAVLVMQDDGDLMVFDQRGLPIWTSNTVQDLKSPTITYTDARGYAYDETSEAWKALCQHLPCFAAMQWPGYASTVVETNIDGQDVVLQLWKGWCAKVLGAVGFPGGVGAEVGVYRRIPGMTRPNTLSLPPELAPLATKILNALGTLADNDLWWPFPELGATVEYTLINPVTGQTVFTAGPERSYWMAKWMDEGSYMKYLFDQHFQAPANPSEYVLDYKVNRKSFARWPGAALPTPPSLTDISYLEPLLLSK